jgi:hypothetical protein
MRRNNLVLNFPISQLVQIVANGGGIEVDAAYVPKDQIVQLAANASSSGAKLVIKNSSRLQQMDLVQIAANGKGAVFFEA